MQKFLMICLAKINSTQNQGTGNLRIQPKSTDQQKAFTSIFNFFNLKSKI